MESETRWVAFDKVEFRHEADCRVYERKNAHKRLIGLKAEQVDRALSGEDVEIAEAIEIVGQRIRRARHERGDLRRKPAARGEAPQDDASVEAAAEEGEAA